MMEKGPPNSSEGQQGWFSARNGSGSSLDLESVVQPLALNPWDVVLCISGTIISCENAIVVVVIFYTPAFRAPMFLLIGSLATADLLAGVGLILHFAFVYFIPSEAVSLLTVGLLVGSFTASVCSLLAITIDRYLSLYNALTYYSERTVTRTYIMLMLTWGASICHGLLPVLGWNCLAEPSACSVVRPLTKSHLVLLSASLLAVLAAMLQLYVQICRIVCRHAHQIAVQRHFLASSHYGTSTRKGIATPAVILGTLASCWLPFAIYGLLGDCSSPALYTYATLLPATYNSLLNPVIYAFRNREIQKVLWAVCCGCVSPSPPFRSRSPSDV
ncbi:G-protein coupled receptor 3 [Molothrus ater]|uniref:G-protein coupled receptor 3 n=1 Tax=Molothrus ater TaxID=84834 RepID=UPI00174C400E|nr:G-protein coupled receptor 3 [Molothrus ater]XP_036253166.1 G-protein coupled receptor 3 [Molothrus ater]XP_054504299.1 G-protein coupled receptor 3 [Agelaius phoeniceus]